MRSHRVLALVAALSLAATLLYGQDAPASGPWGYLYFFRTLRLYSLALDEMEIGRLGENDVVVTSPRVSRRHAVLRRTGAGVELMDVGSSNGTLLNGAPLRPRSPAALLPGDRFELADEPVLFHTSLPDLWREELRYRFLASIIELHLQLPQDKTRKSYGRDETVPGVTDARIGSETGKVEVEHSVELDSESGFPEGAAAFIGNVQVKDGVLELSLWTLAARESMTSRRASFTSLKHATLRISIAERISDGTEDGGKSGPWFPPHLTSSVFEVFPDDSQYSLQFATSLADQEDPVALADAAATLSFRHRLNPTEWKLLLMAVEARGQWIDREIGARGISLGDEEKTRLEAALEEARSWLARARELGAKDEPGQQAEAALAHAGERLSRIQSIP